MVFTNPIAVRSWGRPKSCRTALLAILCWEALRGMKQQLNLNVWILATMGLCVREQLYFGLFGCYQCNIKCNGKRLSMEKNPNRPTQCVQSPKGLPMLGLPSASAGSDCGYGGSMSFLSFLSATFLPQHLCSACQTPQWESSQHLTNSFSDSGFTASLDLHCLTCKLPILSSSPHWSQPLGLAPCWHRGAQHGHTLPREPPKTAPQAGSTLLLCF